MPGLIYQSQLWSELSGRQELSLKWPNNSSDTDSDNDNFDETEPGMLDAVFAQLFNSDTEEEDFKGFVDEE